MFKRQPSEPKPLPFSEEEIRVRAFEISQLRSEKDASPEDDWFAAIEDLKAEHSLPKKFRSIWRMFKFPDQQKLALELALERSKLRVEWFKVGISAAGLVASVIAGVGFWLNYSQGSERLVTDRYSKAVEQLGAKDSSVRIGGIYALERITKDSPKDHWTVMEVLTAFIRERSPQQTEAFTKNPEKAQAKDLQNKATQTEPNPIATDVQSALTVIGRRSTKNKPELRQIDLKGTNLSGAYLIVANLSDADLRDANLSDATLGGTNLSGANLNGANLSNANLIVANLSNTYLIGANLSNADLISTNLSNADLKLSDLIDAYLGGANLSNANLIGANLSNADLSDAIVTEDQLKQAILCKTTLMDGKTRSDRDCEKVKKGGVE